MSGADVGNELIDQISALRIVPQMMVRIAYREFGFDGVFRRARRYCETRVRCARSSISVSKSCRAWSGPSCASK